jgi:phosphohistidine phosphatase SixA
LTSKHYLVFLITLLLLGCQSPVEQPTESAESVFFLVRHAEKADQEDDPPLTDQGQRRARSLANLLSDAGIETVYSSDTLRTRDTAAPIAADLGLDIDIYDPHDLVELAAMLLGSPGRYLVVGHSNTTPELAGLLGGEPGPAIEDSEYDRLYVLTHRPAVGTTTVFLRFRPIGETQE